MDRRALPGRAGPGALTVGSGQWYGWAGPCHGADRLGTSDSEAAVQVRVAR